MDVLTLQPSPSTRGPTPPANTDTAIYQYTLNVTKALSKKLDATRRKQNIEYVFKEGGIVITADAVTFEMLKLATIKYFEQLILPEGEAYIRKVDDKTHTATVQYTIKITRPETNYTINIYTTTSRLLINGPGASHFVSKDIPTIHKIVIDALNQEGIKRFNIDQLNRDLARQLELLLSNTDQNKDDKRQNPLLAEDDTVTCPKCNKKCRTRSAYCTAGRHWIHHKCQKLTEVEILQIENSNPDIDEYYKCKICDKQQANGIRAIQNSIKITAIPENSAKQLLNEELALEKIRPTSPLNELYECIICDGMVTERDGHLCSICSGWCHKKCLIEKDDLYTCIACTANQEYVQIPDETSNDLMLTQTKGQANQENAIQPEQLNTTRQTPVKPIPKPRKIKTKIPLNNGQEDDLKTKLSELRQKEAKLRKQQEQLKLKEKSLNELSSERISLESRCQQLEARNFELEQTVNILKRRIDSNNNASLPSEPKSQNVNEQKDDNDAYRKMKHQIDNRIAEMHTKLSNMVLDEMDKQLDKIKLFEDPVSKVNQNPDPKISPDQETMVQPTIQHESTKSKVTSDRQTIKQQNYIGQPLFHLRGPQQVYPNNSLGRNQHTHTTSLPMVGQQTFRSTNMHPTHRWNSSGLWTPQIAAQQQQPFLNQTSLYQKRM